jgi:hypothetical protein
MEINEETRKQLVPVERIVEMMAHRLKQWQLELEWANHLRDQELARHERDRNDSMQVQNPV